MKPTPQRMLKRMLRLLGGLAALALVWSCNAPFIPVPPPAQAGFTSAQVPDGAGGQKTVWTASGNVGGQTEMVRVFVINEATGNGVVTHAGNDGAYKSPVFDGAKGDHVDIYFEDHGGERSATACLVLQEGAQAPVCPNQ